MVKLFCAVVGVGSVFPVDIDVSETVGDLKEKIKEKKPGLIHFDADLLKLYLAREGDTWLNLQDDELEKFKNGEISDRIKNLMRRELLLKETRNLNNDAYFSKTFERAEDDIHVLVELPSAFGMPSVQQTGLWLVRGSIANALSTKGIRAKLYRLAGMFLGYYDPARYTGDSHSALWYEGKTLCIHVFFETKENALQFENAMQDEPVTLGSALNGHEVTTNVTRINHVPAAELQRVFFIHYDPLESESPQDTMSSISSSSVTVLDSSTDEFRYQRIEHERYFLPYGKAERCHLVSAKHCKHDETFEQYDHDMNNRLALSREMHGFYDGLSYEVPIMNIYPGKVDDKRSIANRYKDGETALHIAAARHGHTLISLLIKHGADVHVRDQAGDTPLTRCLRREVPYSSLEGTYFTAFELIKHGARSPDSFDIIHNHMEHEIITVGYLVEWWINELDEGKPLTKVPFNVLHEGKANTETYLKELNAAKTK